MSERSKRIRNALLDHQIVFAGLENPREIDGVTVYDVNPIVSELPEQILDRALVEKLPDERFSFTRKFQINFIDPGTQVAGKIKFYITAGIYADLRLGEIAIRGDKMGEMMYAALDALAMSISIGLQHGVPLSLFVEKLRGLRGFGPQGFTGDPEFHSATSLFDLIAQWLAHTFPDGKYVNHKNAGRKQE